MGAGFFAVAALMEAVSGPLKCLPAHQPSGITDGTGENPFEAILRRVQKETIAAVSLQQAAENPGCLQDSDDQFVAPGLQLTTANIFLPIDNPSDLPPAPADSPGEHSPQEFPVDRNPGHFPQEFSVEKNPAALNEADEALMILLRPERISAVATSRQDIPETNPPEIFHPEVLFAEQGKIEGPISQFTRPEIMLPQIPIESGSIQSEPKSTPGSQQAPPGIAAAGPGQQQGETLAAQSASVPGADVLVEQIVQGVRLAHHVDGTELQVHLKPEFLGKLSIRILSDAHGLRVEIKADNEMVRQIMQDSLPDLQQRLADKGIVLDHLALLADSHWAQRRKPEADFHSGFPLVARDREEGVETAPGARMAEPLTLIDYLA